MESPKTGIVIINHNTRGLVRACLDSLEIEPLPRVVVVDNGSTDGTREMLRSEYPWVTVLTNDCNPGYAAAANQGIAALKTPYVLLLNSDTLLPDGALAGLAHYLDLHEEVGILGPRLVNPDGTLQRSTFPFPTPFDVLLDSTNLARAMGCVPFLRDAYLRAWPHNRPRRVPWVLGAALMIRREAYEAVGGMDERFFMYFEEVDLCYRCKRAGWQVDFAPVTEITHIGAASTRRRRADMAVQFYASLRRFYLKHYSQLALLELTALVESVALARFLRDWVLYRRARDGETRNRLSQNLAAWRRLAEGEWWKQVANG